MVCVGRENIGSVGIGVTSKFAWKVRAIAGQGRIVQGVLSEGLWRSHYHMSLHSRSCKESWKEKMLLCGKHFERWSMLLLKTRKASRWKWIWSKRASRLGRLREWLWMECWESKRSDEHVYHRWHGCRDQGKTLSKSLTCNKRTEIMKVKKMTEEKIVAPAFDQRKRGRKKNDRRAKSRRG